MRPTNDNRVEEIVRPALLAIACALTLAACAGGSNATATPSPSPLLIASRGITMTLAAAVHLVSYRVHPPRVPLLAVAVIPPLGNEDTPRTRGVAFEYAANGSKWLLSQWPSQHFQLTFEGKDASAMPCAPIAYSNNGVAWMTHDGLAMTLQPDGAGSVKKTTGQARILIARMTCR
jgi:hypothetical protein